ncbi:MAG: hypothetical protein WAO61_05860, partial [Solirubrobacterales bacterium]
SEAAADAAPETEGFAEPPASQPAAPASPVSDPPATTTQALEAADPRSSAASPPTADTGTFEFDWSHDDAPQPPADDSDAVAGSTVSERDVLEDTPEFFEETPEYDRLWFEEKSPKNFDF